MLDTMKDAGTATLAEMFPSMSPALKQQILDRVWTQVLSNALQSNKITITHNPSFKETLTREEFFSQVDDDESQEIIPSKPDSFPMTKQEFLALTPQDIERIEAQQKQTPTVFTHSYSERFFPERADQSKLNKFGYSVSKDSGMSTKQRQDLLTHLISTKQVSRGYVITCLEHLIKINGKRPSNESAVIKWKADLTFVKKLDFNSLQK